MPIKTANDMSTKLHKSAMAKTTNLAQFIKEEYEGESNAVSKYINKLMDVAQLDTNSALQDNENVIPFMEKIFSKIQSKDAFQKFNHIVDELATTEDADFNMYENCLAALMGSVNDKMETPFMGVDELDAICKQVHDTGSINKTKKKSSKKDLQETAPSIVTSQGESEPESESDDMFGTSDKNLLGDDVNVTQAAPSIGSIQGESEPEDLFGDTTDKNLRDTDVNGTPSSDNKSAAVIQSPIAKPQPQAETPKVFNFQTYKKPTVTSNAKQTIEELIEDTFNNTDLQGYQISETGKQYLRNRQSQKNIGDIINAVAKYELLSGIKFNEENGVKYFPRLKQIRGNLANHFKGKFNTKELLNKLCNKIANGTMPTEETLNKILQGNTQGTKNQIPTAVQAALDKRAGADASASAGGDASASASASAGVQPPIQETPTLVTTSNSEEQRLINAGITSREIIKKIINDKIDIDTYIDTWNNSDGNTLSDSEKTEAFKKCLEVVNGKGDKYTNVLMSNDIDLSPLISQHPYHTYTFSTGTIYYYNVIKSNFNKALESIKKPNSDKCIISDPNVTAEKLRDVVAQDTSGKCSPNTNINLIYDTYMVNNEFNKNNPIVAAKIRAAIMDSKQNEAEKIKSGKNWIKVLANAMELTKVNSENELNDDIKNFINNRTVAPTKKELEDFIKTTRKPSSAPTDLSNPAGFQSALDQTRENGGEFTSTVSNPSTGSGSVEPPNPVVPPQPVPADDETDFAPPESHETTSRTANPFGIVDDDFLPPSLEPDFEDDDEEQEMDPRAAYPKVYELIRKYSFNNEQAETASMMADDIIEHRGENPYEFSKLSHIAKDSMDVIYNLIDKANPRLGHREAYSKPATNATSFMNPISTRSVTGATVKSGLAMPPGFKVGFDKSIWDKPVITEFGYPFVNYSNEAIYNLLHAKDEKAQKREYKNLKKMLKEAKLGSKHIHGAIWDAIYASPLKLLKEFATDKGLKCKPNMLKVDGNTLFSLNQGESILVTPIKYYSAKAEYEKPIKVTSSFLTNFYTVLDYSNKKADIESYLKYANGMTQAEFNEEIDRNNGIPPFYILYVEPSNANVFKKSEIATTSGFGSLLHTLFRTRDTNVMVKTRFKGYSGGFVIPKSDAERLFSTIE